MCAFFPGHVQTMPDASLRFPMTFMALPYRVHFCCTQQELIQTYEKTRYNSDERSNSDEVGAPACTSDGGSKRNSRVQRR